MPGINLTKTEIKAIIQAFACAVQDQETLIHAHTVEFSKKRVGGHYIKVVPEEFRGVVRRIKRKMKIWDQIRNQFFNALKK